MSGEANNKPEPIEDKIANAIQRVFEPYIVSLLAATLIQRIGLDMKDAVSMALRVLSASQEGVECNRETRATWKRGMTESASGQWLLCESQALDDSFRQYLSEAGAPEFILKRGFKAHRNALLRHNLLINDGRKDGKACFSLRPAYADKYIQAERDAKSKATKGRRNKDA